MAAKYWIKLYHEILHDRKMAQLSDRLWRRSIELFLFAGELDERGFLPSVDDMAWTLRVGAEFLETEIRELSNVGIIEQRGGRWFVVNFADRQNKMDKAEYMRRLRAERQQGEYYQNDTDKLPDSDQPVTIGNTDTDTDTDIDTEIEEDTEESVKPVALPEIEVETPEPFKPQHLRWLPAYMATEDMVEAWTGWEEYQCDRGKPIASQTARLQLKDISKWGIERAVNAIEHSIKQGYTGLFEPKANGSANGQHIPPGPTFDEIIASAFED